MHAVICPCEKEVRIIASSHSPSIQEASGLGRSFGGASIVNILITTLMVRIDVGYLLMFSRNYNELYPVYVPEVLSLGRTKYSGGLKD